MRTISDIVYRALSAPGTTVRLATVETGTSSPLRVLSWRLIPFGTEFYTKPSPTDEQEADIGFLFVADADLDADVTTIDENKVSTIDDEGNPVILSFFTTLPLKL